MRASVFGVVHRWLFGGLPPLRQPQPQAASQALPLQRRRRRLCTAAETEAQRGQRPPLGGGWRAKCEDRTCWRRSKRRPLLLCGREQDRR